MSRPNFYAREMLAVLYHVRSAVLSSKYRFISFVSLGAFV